MLSKMAKSSSWSQIHKRLAEIIKILSSHRSLVIDILSSTFSAIDKRDYEKIEFIFDQLKVVTITMHALAKLWAIVENNFRS